MHAYFIAATFLALVAGVAVAGSLPLAVPGLYLLASAAAFVAYAWDKSAAQRGAWRTQESTLHVLGLCGGWPGALVARHVFRHKSKKPSFIAAFWITALLNCGVLVWLLTPPGQRLLAPFLDR